MFKKLQRKILLLNMMLISAVMLLAFAAVYVTTWRSVQSENLRKLNTQGPATVSHMETTASPGDSGAVVSYRVSPDYLPSFSIEIDHDGNIMGIDSIMDIPQENYAEAVRMAIDSGKDSGVVKLSDKDWIYKIESATLVKVENGIQTKTETGRHILFLDVTESRQTMRNLMLTLSGVGIVVLVVIYMISLLFSHRAVKPIAEAWQSQRQFIADASHELKTPLTIINTNCDAILESKQETVESQMKWFRYMQIGTDRMEKLISQLLSLAKMDDMNEGIQHKDVDASILVLDTVHAFEAILREKKMKMDCNVEPDVVVKSDGEKVAAIITILLDNAVKYGDSRIHVTLKRTKHCACLTIENDGKGILPNELPQIFNRFYRGDKSRKGDNGYGLGLSIAKAFTERLNGKMNAESKPGEFTKITVMLPA